MNIVTIGKKYTKYFVEKNKKWNVKSARLWKRLSILWWNFDEEIISLKYVFNLVKHLKHEMENNLQSSIDYSHARTEWILKKFRIQIC